jgi:uncharacterized protein YjbI with pentapeptide repeats
MANADHVKTLRQGGAAWNEWRLANGDVTPDLKEVKLEGEDLAAADLRGADLRGAQLRGARLADADLRYAALQGACMAGCDLSRVHLGGCDMERSDLSHAYLEEARLHGVNGRHADLRGVQAYHVSIGSFLPDFRETTDLTGANLNRAWFPSAQLQGAVLDEVQARDADFHEADLHSTTLRNPDLRRSKLQHVTAGNADLTGALLGGADLSRTDLNGAKLNGARLRGANLRDADLRAADLTGADLADADLSMASFIGTVLVRAQMPRARVYGVSTWNVRVEDALQDDLVITPHGEPTITVDDLELAQLVYLLLDNAKIRNVLDTVTSKTVLIIGRFTAERKRILDAMRDHFRTLDLVSIVFDFDRPASRNLTETVTLLARMSRFIVADLTDPSSVPHELGVIVGEVHVPVQPVIAAGHRPYAMFADLLEHDGVLPPYTYASESALLAAFAGELIPAIESARAKILEKRARIAAQLGPPA